MKSGNKPVKYLFIGLGILAGLFLIYIYYNINPAGQSWIPKCPFHSMTGLYCPGCGSQRAIHDFLHFNIIEGLKHNFLLGLGILALFYKVLLLIRSGFYPEKNTSLIQSTKMPWIILFLIFGFWFLRNIPYAPFLILAP